MIDKSKIKRILIIKLRGIGDVVLSTIVLDNLRKDFPQSSVDYLTDEPSKSFLQGLEQINNVLVFPRENIWKRFRLIFEIRNNKYDMILDFFSNPATAQITFLSGAKYKVGFPYHGRKYAYNYFGPKERSKYHSALLHLMTLENLLISTDSENLYFYLSNKDKSFANSYFNENILSDKFVIGLSPSGGWPSKKCDPEVFVEIGKMVMKKYNAEILILWGDSDEKEAKLIHGLISGSFLAPRTTIREMGAFISRCNILIANDSGPMHISTAVGTPVLSLHGPTNPKLQGPFGNKHEWINYAELDCIICNLLTCPKNHECFKNLPLARVIEKIDLLISKNNLRHVN